MPLDQPALTLREPGINPLFTAQSHWTRPTGHELGWALRRLRSVTSGASGLCQAGQEGYSRPRQHRLQQFYGRCGTGSPAQIGYTTHVSP